MLCEIVPFYSNRSFSSFLSLFSLPMADEQVKIDARKRWKALESNPEVMTNFGRKLGLKEVRSALSSSASCHRWRTVSVPGKEWEFTDIFGLDPDLLAMVPQPCLSVVLLFPSNKKVWLAFFSFPQRKVLFVSPEQPPDRQSCWTRPIW